LIARSILQMHQSLAPSLGNGKTALAAILRSPGERL
jgi:hypothetical protein